MERDSKTRLPYLSFSLIVFTRTESEHTTSSEVHIFGARAAAARNEKGDGLAREHFCGRAGS